MKNKLIFLTLAFGAMLQINASETSGMSFEQFKQQAKDFAGQLSQAVEEENTPVAPSFEMERYLAKAAFDWYLKSLSTADFKFQPSTSNSFDIVLVPVRDLEQDSVIYTDEQVQQMQKVKDKALAFAQAVAQDCVALANREDDMSSDFLANAMFESYKRLTQGNFRLEPSSANPMDYVVVPAGDSDQDTVNWVAQLQARSAQRAQEFAQMEADRKALLLQREQFEEAKKLKRIVTSNKPSKILPATVLEQGVVAQQPTLSTTNTSMNVASMNVEPMNIEPMNVEPMSALVSDENPSRVADLIKSNVPGSPEDKKDEPSFITVPVIIGGIAAVVGVSGYAAYKYGLLESPRFRNFFKNPFGKAVEQKTDNKVVSKAIKRK